MNMDVVEFFFGYGETKKDFFVKKFLADNGKFFLGICNEYDKR